MKWFVGLFFVLNTQALPPSWLNMSTSNSIDAGVVQAKKALLSDAGAVVKTLADAGTTTKSNSPSDGGTSK